MRESIDKHSMPKASDTQKINRKKTNIEVIKDIRLDTELACKLLEEVPSDMNKFDKAIYVYARMCMLLDYDAQYLANDMFESKKQLVRANPDNISKINLKNNEVVCFDFCAIYAKVLKALGVDFELIDGNNFHLENQPFGDYHTSLVITVPEIDNLPAGLEPYDRLKFEEFVDLTSAKVLGNIIGIKKYVYNGTGFSWSLSSETTQDLPKETQEYIDKIVSKACKSLNLCANIPAVEANEGETDTKTPLMQKVSAFDKQLQQLSPEVKDLSALLYCRKNFKRIFADNLKYGDKCVILREKVSHAPSQDEYAFKGVVALTGGKEDKQSRYFFTITPPSQLKSGEKMLQPIDTAKLRKAFADGKIDYCPSYFTYRVIIPDFKSRFIEQDISARRENYNRNVPSDQKIKSSQYGLIAKKVLPCKNADLDDLREYCYTREEEQKGEWAM